MSNAASVLAPKPKTPFLDLEAHMPASGQHFILGLLALEIGPADEVITPPFTLVATANSIAGSVPNPCLWTSIREPVQHRRAGDPESYHPRTRAIMPVHLLGSAAEMSEIEEVAGNHGIPVIEDAAQAIGARFDGRAVGNSGLLGCFSFFYQRISAAQAMAA